MTEQLLTEPELTPIVEAFLETQNQYNRALEACGWSMSLQGSYSYDERLSGFIAENIAKMTERKALLEVATIWAERFADFANAGIDELAAEYNSALRRYWRQQREIADKPRREWAAAYNARLSALDSQIKGLKIRRGKLWSKFDKSAAMTLAEYDAAYAAISAEIEALEQRREAAAAERFEGQAA